jgi:hypothetical protein
MLGILILARIDLTGFQMQSLEKTLWKQSWFDKKECTKTCQVSPQLGEKDVT